MTILPALDLHSRLNGAKTVLNLGAGKCHSPISQHFLDYKCLIMYNVEAFIPYYNELNRLAEEQKFEALVTINRNDDALEFTAGLDDNLFDVVAIIDVLEHFNRTKGQLLLEHSLRVCRDHVVVWVPIGPCLQEPYDGNELQRHLSTWELADFAEDGVSVDFYDKFHDDLCKGAAWVTYRKSVFVGIQQ